MVVRVRIRVPPVVLSLVQYEYVLGTMVVRVRTRVLPVVCSLVEYEYVLGDDGCFHYYYVLGRIYKYVLGDDGCSCNVVLGRIYV